MIIAAHNEASVITRTLASLAGPLARGDIEVVVAANGCDDDTARLARRFEGVKVLDLATPSKTTALNAAERTVSAWPRIYLDADIDLPESVLQALIAELATTEALAARPSARYRLEGASWPVRAYWGARRRLPATDQHLWGAGVYAMNERGRSRFVEFPHVIADDLFVDSLFAPSEKVIVDQVCVEVRVPRDLANLLATLHRTYRGNAEIARIIASGEVPIVTGSAPSGSGRTARSLVSTITGPRSARDAAVYAAIAIWARWPRHVTPRWGRDESNR